MENQLEATVDVGTHDLWLQAFSVDNPVFTVTRERWPCGATAPYYILQYFFKVLNIYTAELT